MREARELGDPISCLENTYIRLCEVVHARGIVLPSKLVQCTLPKRSDSQILKEKQLYRDVMRNVVLLLMIYHKEKVHRFNALKKEASLYSLPHSIMQTVRAHLGI